MIPLFYPHISKESKELVNQVLNGKQIGQGPLVDLLEKEYGEKYGFNYCLTVNSGTSALHLAYVLAGIGEGDEVITPVLTCTATNIPLLHMKAKPVFADIDSLSLNIDPKDVLKKITPKTKAIVFVHFGGNNKNLDEILEIANTHGLKVIEDAAQAAEPGRFGFGDFTCVSFQAIKTITGGDGGMLIVKNNQHYQRAKKLRWFGIDRELKSTAGNVDIAEPGFKYHMNDITAAIVLGNLHDVDLNIAHRKQLLNEYEKRTFIVEGTIWLAITFVRDREQFMKFLKDHEIETGIHHYRNDKYTIFKQYKNECPNMDAIENQYVLLPLNYFVSARQVERICSLIRQVR